MFELTKGAVPIIGVGGIEIGRDAYDKIRNGASLVQLYSGLVYGGPSLTKAIKEELSELIKQDGFQNVSEAVGANLKSK